MKYLIIATCIVIGLFLSFSPVFAEGNVERGKSLFNDPTLSGSTNSNSCNTCHSDGSGLKNAGSKKFTSFMGASASSLEDVINICIERPLGGKPLAGDSQDMKDLVAYITSLGKM